MPLLNSKAQHLLSLRATKSICINVHVYVCVIAYVAAGSDEAMGIRPPDDHWEVLVCDPLAREHQSTEELPFSDRFNGHDFIVGGTWSLAARATDWLTRSL